MLNAARRARLQRGRDAAIRETAGVASQKPKGRALQKKGTLWVHGAAERPAGRSSKVRTGQWPWIWQCGGPRSPKGRRVEESGCLVFRRGCVMATGVDEETGCLP